MSAPRVSAAALLLAALAAISAVSIAVPALSYPLWVARLVAVETSLAAAALAAGAIVLAAVAERRSPGGRRGRIALLLAIPALVVTMAPPLAALRRFGARSFSFSLAEYAGAPFAPAMRREADVVLDPGVPGLALDLYRPQASGRHPLVAIVHGGSWRSGAKGQAAHVSRALAAAGYVVADLGYRLAPEHRFPAGVADVKCLVGRLRGNADRLGIDPGRVVLLGRSAGGEIALVAAYSAGDPRLAPSCAVEDRPVSAVIALYPPTDLAWGHAHPIRPDVVRGPESIELYLGGTPESAPDAYRLASPLTWADHALPPTLLVHGTDDRLVSVEHSRRLARGLRAAGQPVDLVEIPFADHAFDARPGGFGEQLSRQVIARFLADVFSRSGTGSDATEAQRTQSSTEERPDRTPQRD
jgi:acetyl esterase/lipase